MIVYRLSRKRYAEDLSGRGAELAGGRWNSKGTALVYTGQNISLCMVEVAVHLPLGIVPKDYELISIEIPDDEIQELETDKFDWQSALTFVITRDLGDEFARKSEKLILKVPSAVVQGEFNYLINPKHPKIKKVKIKKVEAFGFDDRLFLR